MNRLAHALVASAILAGVTFTGPSLADELAAQAVEAGAVLALNRMSTHLRNLRQFEVRSDIDTDYLSVDKQVITKTRQVTLRVQLPNRLFASISHPGRQRDFYFDGRHATLYAPAKGYYATADLAAPTVRELIAALNEKYGIDIPLADLFEWSRHDVGGVEFQTARYAGAAVIDGSVCDQYAFRSQGAQWQLWIARTGFPLPCRLSIANDDAERLRSTVTYHWNTAARFAPSQFVFKPPRGAMKIEITEVKTP